MWETDSQSDFIEALKNFYVFQTLAEKAHCRVLSPTNLYDAYVFHHIYDICMSLQQSLSQFAQKLFLLSSFIVSAPNAIRLV